MNRSLLFLSVAAGVVGGPLLLLSVLVCDQAGLNIGLVAIMSSAILLIITVVLERTNRAGTKYP